jgi:endo-1,4-beta-mannosidase
VSPDDPVLATFACLDEDEMAAYCRNVLERLHADGRLGAYWWCWADYDAALRAEPPFDRAPHELSFGIVRSDGSEKPVAAALAAFARERRTVIAAREMPMIAEVYSYRTLPSSTRTLFEAFLGRVEERRSGTR